MTGADDKAEWYDKYVDQDMSRDANPLSLEQLRNALTYLDTQNNLRKANGQSRGERQSPHDCCRCTERVLFIE